MTPATLRRSPTTTVPKAGYSDQTCARLPSDRVGSSRVSSRHLPSPLRALDEALQVLQGVAHDASDHDEVWRQLSGSVAPQCRDRDNKHLRSLVFVQKQFLRHQKNSLLYSAGINS